MPQSQTSQMPQSQWRQKMNYLCNFSHSQHLLGLSSFSPIKPGPCYFISKREKQEGEKERGKPPQVSKTKHIYPSNIPSSRHVLPRQNQREIQAKQGLPSADRNNKATLLLTGPFRTAKSSAEDLTPRVFKLQYAKYHRALRARWRNRLLRYEAEAYSDRLTCGKIAAFWHGF